MTTAFDPSFDAPAAGEPVGDWKPCRYTPTLTGTEDFRTDGDKLLVFAARHWSIPDALRLVLDEWQRWLIRHILERYPDDWPVEHLRGQLRYRQVVISMGRQNGKSLIAALLVIYFLALHVRGPRVIGLASIDRQAKIVYDRVKFGIDNSPALAREIKTTNTRGITRRDGSGVYQTLPAKEESAQGEPASGGIYDELHLGLAALWDALVLAQRARRNALLVGITTAGDDNSELLIRLYAEGEAAIAGEDERFGFFLWEAEDDELTEANVIRANPAVACGRIPLDLTMHEARKMDADTKRGPDGLTGRQRRIRYTNNRFISGAADAWTSTHAWAQTVAVEPLDHGEELVFGIERTENYEHASITATSKAPNGYRSELVASFNEPDHELLLDACKTLARTHPGAAFTLDRRTLADLGKALKDEGFEVWALTANEVETASQHAHAVISRREVEHPDDSLIRTQLARGRRRSTSDGWRLSRTLSGGDIDAVLATVYGLYVAAVRPENTMQLF